MLQTRWYCRDFYYRANQRFESIFAILYVVYQKIPNTCLILEKLTLFCIFCKKIAKKCFFFSVKRVYAKRITICFSVFMLFQGNHQLWKQGLKIFHFSTIFSKIWNVLKGNTQNRIYWPLICSYPCVSTGDDEIQGEEGRKSLAPPHYSPFRQCNLIKWDIIWKLPQIEVAAPRRFLKLFFCYELSEKIGPKWPFFENSIFLQYFKTGIEIKKSTLCGHSYLHKLPFDILKDEIQSS